MHLFSSPKPIAGFDLISQVMLVCLPTTAVRRTFTLCQTNFAGHYLEWRMPARPKDLSVGFGGRAVSV